MNGLLMTISQDISRKLWKTGDPYAGFPAVTYQGDSQGWGSDHPYLVESIPTSGQCIVVEIGVWKGASTINIARAIRDRGIDGCVVAIDTWLGSVDHWLNDRWTEELGFVFGYPTLQRKFIKNVISAGLQDIVIPLPLDSLNAAAVLYNIGVRPNLIHVDGGHEYYSVLSDLRAWWPLVADGGMLIGDDYHQNGGWPGVKRAFDEFCNEQGNMTIEEAGGKCRIYKP